MMIACQKIGTEKDLKICGCLKPHNILNIISFQRVVENNKIFQKYVRLYVEIATPFEITITNQNNTNK